MSARNELLSRNGYLNSQFPKYISPRERRPPDQEAQQGSEESFHSSKKEVVARECSILLLEDLLYRFCSLS